MMLEISSVLPSHIVLTTSNQLSFIKESAWPQYIIIPQSAVLIFADEFVGSYVFTRLSVRSLVTYYSNLKTQGRILIKYHWMVWQYDAKKLYASGESRPEIKVI